MDSGSRVGSTGLRLVSFNVTASARGWWVVGCQPAGRLGSDGAAPALVAWSRRTKIDFEEESPGDARERAGGGNDDDTAGRRLFDWCCRS